MLKKNIENASTQILTAVEDIQATMILAENDNYHSKTLRSPNNNNNMDQLKTQILCNEEESQATMLLHDEYSYKASVSNKNHLKVSSNNVDNLPTQLLGEEEEEIQATMVLPEKDEYSFNPPAPKKNNNLKLPSQNVDNLPTQVLGMEEEEIQATMVLPENDGELSPTLGQSHFKSQASGFNMDDLQTQVLENEDEVIQATMVLPEDDEHSFKAPVPKKKNTLKVSFQNVDNLPTQVLGMEEEEIQATMVLPENGGEFDNSNYNKPKNLTANLDNLTTQLVGDDEEKIHATFVLPENEEHHIQVPKPRLSNQNFDNLATQVLDDEPENFLQNPQNPKNLLSSQNKHIRERGSNMENLQTQLLEENEMEEESLNPRNKIENKNEFDNFPTQIIRNEEDDHMMAGTMVLPEENFHRPKPKLFISKPRDENLETATTQILEENDHEINIQATMVLPEQEFKVPVSRLGQKKMSTVDLENAPTQFIENEELEESERNFQATMLLPDQSLEPSSNLKTIFSRYDLENAPTQLANENEDEANGNENHYQATLILPDRGSNLNVSKKSPKLSPIDLMNAPTQLAGDDEENIPGSPNQNDDKAMLLMATILDEGDISSGNPISPITKKDALAFQATMLDEGNNEEEEYKRDYNQETKRENPPTKADAPGKKIFMSVPVLTVTQNTEANDLTDLFDTTEEYHRRPILSNENSTGSRGMLQFIKGSSKQIEDKKNSALKLSPQQETTFKSIPKSGNNKTDNKNTTQTTQEVQVTQSLEEPTTQEEEKNQGRKVKVIKDKKKNTEKLDPKKQEKMEIEEETASKGRKKIEKKSITDPTESQTEEEGNRRTTRTRSQVKKEEEIKKEETKKYSKITTKQNARTRKGRDDEEDEEGGDEEEEEKNEKRGKIAKTQEKNKKNKENQEKPSLEIHERESTIPKKRKTNEAANQVIEKKSSTRKGAKNSEEQQEKTMEIEPNKRNAYMAMFSGFEKDDQDVEDSKKALKNLGIKIVQEKDKNFNLLIMDKFKRTIKLLLALNKGIDIVNYKWVQDCIAANKILSPSDYVFTDNEAEIKFAFQMKKSLEVAKKKEKGILDGYRVYLPTNIKPSFEELKLLLESADAEVIKTKPTSHKNEILIILNEDDKKAITLFKDLGYKPYTTELIFSGVLQQKLNLRMNFA